MAANTVTCSPPSLQRHAPTKSTVYRTPEPTEPPVRVQPFEGDTTLRIQYNPVEALGTPVEYSRPSLLFKVKMYSVRQDFSANATWGLRKPKPTMDTFKKLHSPRSYNLCVIMTTFSRTTGRQPACQNQTNRNAANYSHVPPVHQSRGNPTSLFPAPSLTDSPHLHQKCPPRKGPLRRWIQYSPDMVWSATSQQVQPQSVPIIDVFKMFSSI